MKTAFFFLFYSMLVVAQQAHSQNPAKSTEEWIQVYKYNTEFEKCDSGGLVPHDAPHALQKTLDHQGILVRSALRGHDGLMYALSSLDCAGVPTISIFEIPETSYKSAQQLGFQLCQNLTAKGGGCYPASYSDRVLPDKNQEVRRIYKYAQRKQCQADSGQDVQTMEEELIKAKVVVFQRYRGMDGLLYPLSCGSETGEINIYIIEKSALAVAFSFGYRECAYLKELGGACHPLATKLF